MSLFKSLYAFIIKKQSFKQTFIYRAILNIKDNTKDNFVISQWVSSITTLNCPQQKR